MEEGMILIYDKFGNVMYDNQDFVSYFYIGEFTVNESIYPQGTSTGYGPVVTVLTNPSISPQFTFLYKKQTDWFNGYSYGHYPNWGDDGDGYSEIVVHEGYITAQFKRRPANGTKGYRYFWDGGTYEVWGARRE